MNLLLISLLGALCWGLAPIFGKIGLRHVDPLDGLVARTLITLGFILLWILATGRLHRIVLISYRDWLFLGVEAFLATLAGDLAYYAALKWGHASVVSVLLATSPVVTIWAAEAFLHESLTPTQIWGTVLVLAGMLLVVNGGGHP